MKSIWAFLQSFVFLASTTMVVAAEHVPPRATMALDRGWRFTLDDGGHERAAPQFDDSDGRNEGDHAGRNDKGLVTYDRRTRKDAFHWYQANWSARPIVHIVAKRHTDRSEAQTEIRVYSNADEVEVVFNGIELGRKSSPDRRFVWSGIELKRGSNLVNATAYRGGRPVATDSACWIYRAAGDPLPNLPVAETDAAAAASL